VAGDNTHDDLNKEIDTSRQEIAALQKRISEMVARRKKTEAISDAHDTNRRTARNDPRVLKIDPEIDTARERMKIHPSQSKAIQTQIESLETERYRLLLKADED
jgi:hypothetical protein